jgi:hypothetical protein
MPFMKPAMVELNIFSIPSLLSKFLINREIAYLP